MRYVKGARNMLHQFMQMRGGMQLFGRVEDEAAHDAIGSVRYYGWKEHLQVGQRKCKKCRIHGTQRSLRGRRHWPHMS